MNNVPESMGEVLVEVDDVYKGFEDKHVLEGVSLDVRKGETLTVLGKSGTGKSVLLKLIVKLLDPDKGRIRYRGEDLHEADATELSKIRKNIGFLFQGAALFDSMTVGENLDLFLTKHTKLDIKIREEKIVKALEVVGLGDALDKMPSELSGGMKKRAGLARSIVLEPELILYDEPTTGLDPVTAASIAELILTLQLQLGLTSVVVTHDLPTAYTVTDRAIVLDSGRKIFEGSIEELENSKNAFLREYFHSSELDPQRRNATIKNARERKLDQLITT